MCFVIGYFKLKIVWIVNDMFIVGLYRYRMILDGILFIKNVVFKDVGIYGCLVSNLVGIDKQSFIFRYIEVFKLMVVQSEFLVVFGDIIVMECKIFGIFLF